MPHDRRFHRINYKDILNGNAKPNRVLALLDALKHNDPLPEAPEEQEVSDTKTDIQPDISDANTDTEKTVEEEITDASTSIPSISIHQDEETPGWFVRNDNKLSDATTYIENALAFIEIIKHAENKAKLCFEKISEEDRIIQDILHEIRQPVKNAEDGFNLYKLLHQAERRRQDYKDLAEPLCLISKYVNAHRSIFEGFIPIMKAANQRVENQKHRVYMQKSDAIKLPVGDAYRQLPKAEQDRIKAIYEQNKHNREKYSFTG